MPDRFATGASAIRPTPDAHLSWFHWDRLASSSGKRSFRLGGLAEFERELIRARKGHAIIGPPSSAQRIPISSLRLAVPRTAQRER
jgi:hypothetical protein